MSTTTTITTSPTQVHAAAVERHADLRAKADQAAETLAVVQEERNDLLSRAAGGEGVTASDLRAHEDKIRDQEAELVLANAIADAAQRRADEAELGVLVETKERHLAAFADAIRDLISDAAELDAAILVANEKVPKFVAGLAKLQAVVIAAGAHDRDVHEKMVKNRVLAGLDDPSLPWAGRYTRIADMRSVTPDLVYAGRQEWGEVSAIRISLEGAVRGHYAHLLPPAPPAEAEAA